MNVLKLVIQEPNSQPENVMKTKKAQTPAMEIIKNLLEAWIDFWNLRRKQGNAIRKDVQVIDWFSNNVIESRAWVRNLKQRVPITSKSSKFKGATQHYVVKLPKSAGARHYCPKIQRVPGTHGTRANSSPVFIIQVSG